MSSTYRGNGDKLQSEDLDRKAKSTLTTTQVLNQSSTENSFQENTGKEKQHSGWRQQPQDSNSAVQALHQQDNTHQHLHGLKHPILHQGQEQLSREHLQLKKNRSKHQAMCGLHKKRKAATLSKAQKTGNTSTPMVVLGWWARLPGEKRSQMDQTSPTYPSMDQDIHQHLHLNHTVQHTHTIDIQTDEVSQTRDEWTTTDMPAELPIHLERCNCLSLWVDRNLHLRML